MTSTRSLVYSLLLGMSLSGCTAINSPENASSSVLEREARLAMINVNMSMAAYARTFDLRAARLAGEVDCTAMFIVPLPPRPVEANEPEQIQTQIFLDFKVDPLAIEYVSPYTMHAGKEYFAWGPHFRLHLSEERELETVTTDPSDERKFLKKRRNADS